jgi:hypothetical protein
VATTRRTLMRSVGQSCGPVGTWCDAALDPAAGVLEEAFLPQPSARPFGGEAGRPDGDPGPEPYCH